MEELKLDKEFKEQVLKIKNDLQKEKIEIRNWAEFAISFYKKFKNNYNEKLLIKIIKEVIEFYNKNLEISEKRKQIRNIDGLLEKIAKNKEEILVLYKIKNLNNNFFNKEKFDYNDSQFKEWEEELERNRDKNFELKDKKFFFFSKKRKQKEAKVIIESLEKLSAEIKNSIEDIKIEVEEKDKDILRLFENINEDLKKFLFEVKDNIGVELAKLEYKKVISDFEITKKVIFSIILKNLCDYFKDKEIN